MRATSILRSAIVTTAPLVLTVSFASAQGGAEVLVSEGDVLPNGWVVAQAKEHALADDGRWAAIVQTFEMTADANEVLMIDGQVVVAEGDTFGGETIRYLNDVAMSPGGQVAVAYVVHDPAGSTDSQSRLVLQGGLVLSEDDPIVATGIPPGSTVEQILDVSLDLPKIMLHLEVLVPAGTLERFLVSFTVVNGVLLAPSVEAQVGVATGGLAGPIEFIQDGFAIDAIGNHIAPVSFELGGVGEYAVLLNGASYIENGQPGFLVNSVWDSAYASDVAIRNGFRAASARLRLSNGNYVGVVTDQYGRVVQRGTALPVGNVGDFSYCDVDVSMSGNVAYAVPLDSGEACLALQRVPVLLTNTSRASGRLITDIRHTYRSVVQVSGDERWMTCRLELDGADDALVRIDRSIGEATNCPVNPNSTGQTGRLTAIGSRQIAFESVEITADQLPANAFGFMLTSTTPGFAANPGGSAGNVCLGGNIGRFMSQVASSGPNGVIYTELDLSAIPQPTGTVAVMSGERWGFQLWHRDTSMGGGGTSNFTEAISILFQ